MFDFRMMGVRLSKPCVRWLKYMMVLSIVVFLLALGKPLCFCSHPGDNVSTKSFIKLGKEAVGFLGKEI